VGGGGATSVRLTPALAHAEALDLAVVAIGAWMPGESAVWEKVTLEVQQACTRAGAVAEFSGTFLDARGAAAQTPLDGRVIAVGLPQLRAARRVIGFAHGPGRATALRAAAASATCGHRPSCGH
jgi:DNA-binding transcriptional regulator LsrR (DeoR family)